MAKYSIPEVNLPKLENEMKTLENKIKKYGGNFSYKVIGEHFEEVEVYGEMKKVLFFDIEVEGELKFNDWEYCSSIENTQDGNIIVNKDGGHEIPEEYYYSTPKCDHCGSNRYRRYTYIIRNSKTGEFKQVGKGCLEDYTKGLSANALAQLAEFFKNIQKISKDRSNEIYYENTEKLLTSLQSYLDGRRIKYYRTFELPENYDGSTTLFPRFEKGYNPYRPCKITWTPKKVNCGYTPKSFYDSFIRRQIEIPEDKAETYKTRFEEAKTWFANQEDNRGNEFHNYKTLISQEEIPFEDVGILCNGFIEYMTNYHIEKELKTYDEIRNTYIKNKEEALLKAINELKKYEVDGSRDDKYGSVTLVKKIELNFGTHHQFFLDNENNLYYIPEYYLPEELNTDSPFVALNIRYHKDTLKFNKYFINGKEGNLEVTYYDIREVSTNSGRRITEYKNINEVINEVYDSREDITGDMKEPKRVQEFYGNISDTITVELVNGLKFVISSYRGSSLYEGLDKDGRCFGIWSKKSIGTSRPVEITGKIWKHNNYKGVKSTLVNLDNLREI